MQADLDVRNYDQIDLRHMFLFYFIKYFLIVSNEVEVHIFCDFFEQHVVTSYCSVTGLDTCPLQ